MKYFKILLLLITFSSISNAEIIKNVFLDTHYTKCIYNNFYAKNGRYYSQDVTDDDWYSTSSDDRMDFIVKGYEYDTETEICSPTFATKNGITTEQHNFLLAMVGIIFGSVFMFFTVQAFTNVGGKK